MSEPTPLDLPVGLRWVKLVCRLGRLVTDSTADVDAHPDLIPVGGTLRLAASPSRVRIQEADGRWRSVEIAGRAYTIRADGELVDNEGRVGVYIPDPTSLLVEPQGYAITAMVKPTGGAEWRVVLDGSTVLPDEVDLVAVSSVGSVSPSVTASFDARLYALEQGGGVDVSQIVEDYLIANPPVSTSVVVLDYGESPPEPQDEGVLYVRVTTPTGDYAPAMLTQPQNVSTTVGDNVVLTSTASGSPTPTVLWEFHDGTGWAPVSGGTSQNLSLNNVTLAMSGHQYRVTYTNSLGSATSNVVTLTVNEVAGDPPVVTLHPSNTTVQDGSAASFTSTASGAVYQQWQINTGTGWTNISGSTSTTYQIPSALLSMTGNLYRIGFTNSGGTTYSNAATLTVTETVVEPTLEFSDDFDRADGPIEAPWVLDSGTSAVIDNGGLRANASGYHRVSPGAFSGPLRIEGTIGEDIRRFTGLYLGRSTTNPTTYPGIKVATTQETLGFTTMSAETVYGTTLDNLSELTTAVAPDEAVGGVLAVEWDGTEVRYFWNGVQVDFTPAASVSALIAPGEGLVGIIGSGTTGSRWTDFKVWSL